MGGTLRLFGSVRVRSLVEHGAEPGCENIDAVVELFESRVDSFESALNGLQSRIEGADLASQAGFERVASGRGRVLRAVDSRGEYRGFSSDAGVQAVLESTRGGGDQRTETSNGDDHAKQGGESFEGWRHGLLLATRGDHFTVRGMTRKRSKSGKSVENPPAALTDERCGERSSTTCPQRRAA